MSAQVVEQLINFNTKRLFELERERLLVEKIVEQNLEIPHRWFDTTCEYVKNPVKSKPILTYTFNESEFQDEIEKWEIENKHMNYQLRCMGHKEISTSPHTV